MKISQILVEDVKSFLRNNIINGNFTQGEKLSETSLQKKLRISRSPIREALRILAVEGLVEILPRKGAYVKKITMEEMNNMTVVVANLEALAARLALPRLTDKHFKKMVSLVKKMEQQVRKFSTNDYTKTHNDFHETFILPCNNPILTDLVAKLRRLYVRPSITLYYFMNNIEDAVKGHLRIIDTLKKGNPQEVEDVVKNHIINALIKKTDF